MPTVAAIPRKEGKNHVGFKRLYAAPAVDVSAIAAATSGDVASAITMVTDKVFYEIPLDPEAGAYLTTEGSTSEGTTGHNYTLNVFLAGNDAAQDAVIDQWDGVYSIYIGERMDGTLKIIGEVGRGLRLVTNKEESKGGRSGSMMSGSMDYNHLPYSYSDGTIAE